MALSRSMKNLMHESAQARKAGGNPGHGGGGMSGMVGRAMQQARARQAQQAPQRPGAEADPNMVENRMRAARGIPPVTKPTPGTGGVVGPAVQPPAAGRGTRGPLGTRAPGAGQRNTGRSFLGKRTPRTGGVAGPVPRPSPGGAGGTMRPAVMPIQRGGPGTIAGKPMPRPGTGGVVGPGGGTFGFAGRGGGRGTPALQQATAGARSQMARQAAARGAGTGGVIQPPGTPRPADQASRFGAAMKRAKTAGGPAAMARQAGGSVRERLGARQGPPARRGGMARALGSGGSRRRMLR